MKTEEKKTLLLLSSLRLLISGNLPPVLGKPFNQFKVAYVITASKGVSDRAYFERNRNFFREQKYNCVEVDLDEKKGKNLKSILENVELVYVEGGNSFLLLKAIRESGFENIVKELLPQGLIYMGASAGSYIACPTIEMATWAHQDKYNHYAVTDLTAMNLVPFLLTVHYKPEYRELLKEKISQAVYPVKILTDKQALLIKDGKVELIGNGEEVVLS
ncbi:MAG: Peptidase (Peptidase family S51) [Parcubacteria group bacterium GW2011_GWA2_44_15]|nr:MAG: Peptidase (Peptidase family S51) [Parcubacteria group bacterium GW2011_GWA2_44_15]